MKIFHDSHNKNYRDPFGAVTLNTTVKISIEVVGTADEVRLHWIIDGKKEQLIVSHSEKEISDGKMCFEWEMTKDTVGLVWYYFSVVCKSGALYYYGNNADFLGGEGAMYNRIPPAFQITFYEQMTVAPWFQNGIIYHIFPDRFHRGQDFNERSQMRLNHKSKNESKSFLHADWNDSVFHPKNPAGEVTHWGFFGGTIQGIEEKLIYLKSLHVTTIYMTPIFEAHSNHKYDTGDYSKIDFGFGDDETFKSLIENASKLGINIILDGVFSHTGSDSIYFNKYGNYDSVGAFQSEDSQYHSWYNFRRFPNFYDCWWGVVDLPNVNEENASFKDFLFNEKDGIIPYWMNKGVKGFRLDVADELPDSFIEQLTSTVKRCDAEGVVIGEVWEDASYKESYDRRREYLLGRELDSTMNYPFRSVMVGFALGEISATRLTNAVMSLKENYPKEIFYSLMNLLGSHDTERLITLLGISNIPHTAQQKEFCKLTCEEYDLGKKRLKMLATMQFASIGVPSIYYGDEAGVQGWSDPYNRGTYPWGNEDTEILSHYQTISYLRNLYPVLKDGEYLPYKIDDDDIYAFWRHKEGCDYAVFAISNRSTSNKTINLNVHELFEIYRFYAIDLFTSQKHEIVNGKLTIDIQPLSATLICVNFSSMKSITMKNGAGILCHLSSLPHDEDGLYASAQKFIDYLASAGQSYWQVLPLNPVDFMGSPYATSSVFAGNDKLLYGKDLELLEYTKEFDKYCKKESFWLDDYALFASISDKYEGKPWQVWEDYEKDRTNLTKIKKEHKDAIKEHKVRQFAFWKTWENICQYAKSKNIEIIGDLPIYVSDNSTDCWAARNLFELNEKGYPALSAGVPPDFFSEEGQGWGNPLYNFDEMKKDGYNWWKLRLKYSVEKYDYVRLDHFRAFAGYYAIPEGNSAKNGFWKAGVGKEFFRIMEKELGDLPIIAEDLGILDSSVYDLMRYTGFPGMNIYHFHKQEMENMPECIQNNRIFYSATHDNQTTVSWCQANGYDGTAQEMVDEVVESIYKSKSKVAIIPIQDVLYLDDNSRMNTPGVASGNWTFKISAQDLKEQDAKRLYELVKKYERLPN